MTPPVVSVVVLNWNGRSLLEDCLGSVLRQTFRDYEVILVDNGSTDGSAAWVRERFPQVRLLALEENLGFCGGNNAGFRVARGRYVALLNNDTEVEPDWLERLYAVIAADPRIAACDSSVLYFDRRDVVWSRGATYTIAGTANFRDQGRLARDLPGEPADVFAAVACAALYRRAALDEVGDLDEAFFAGYEDIDWSFRARLRGYRIVNVPAARVYHKVSATHGYNSPAYVYHGQRNVLMLFLKNMPASLLVRYAPLHLVYTLGSLAYFVRAGRGGAFVRGKVDALRRWPSVWRKRRAVQGSRAVTAAAIDVALLRGWLGPKTRKFTQAKGSHA